jgi:hypothetical protein
MSYRVRFFKHLVSSQGRQFKTLQGNFEPIEAKTAAEAEVIAEREFQRLRRIPAWQLHADSVEINSY